MRAHKIKVNIHISGNSASHLECSWNFYYCLWIRKCYWFWSVPKSFDYIKM